MFCDQDLRFDGLYQLTVSFSETYLHLWSEFYCNVRGLEAYWIVVRTRT